MYMYASILTLDKHLLLFAPPQLMHVSEDDPGGHKYSPKGHVDLHCDMYKVFVFGVHDEYYYRGMHTSHSIFMFYLQSTWTWTVLI
jgi:hypothetical protein